MFNNSIIQGLKDSKIQRFDDLMIQGFGFNFVELKVDDLKIRGVDVVSDCLGLFEIV